MARHDGESAERIRSAEHQARRRGEIPAVAAAVVGPWRGVSHRSHLVVGIIPDIRKDIPRLWKAYCDGIHEKLGIMS